MSAHTPGPWRWVGPFLDASDLVSDHGPIIEYQSYEGQSFAGTSDAQDEANARLIAAAPELLEALREVMAEVEDCCAVPADEWDFVAKVRTAIAKATGEQP